MDAPSTIPDDVGADIQAMLAANGAKLTGLSDAIAQEIAARLGQNQQLLDMVKARMLRSAAGKAAANRQKLNTVSDALMGAVSSTLAGQQVTLDMVQAGAQQQQTTAQAQTTGPGPATGYRVWCDSQGHKYIQSTAMPPPPAGFTFVRAVATYPEAVAAVCPGGTTQQTTTTTTTTGPAVAVGYIVNGHFLKYWSVASTLGAQQSCPFAAGWSEDQIRSCMRVWTITRPGDPAPAGVIAGPFPGATLRAAMDAVQAWEKAQSPPLCQFHADVASEGSWQQQLIYNQPWYLDPSGSCAPVEVHQEQQKQTVDQTTETPPDCSLCDVVDALKGLCDCLQSTSTSSAGAAVDFWENPLAFLTYPEDEEYRSKQLDLAGFGELANVKTDEELFSVFGSILSDQKTDDVGLAPGTPDTDKLAWSLNTRQ